MNLVFEKECNPTSFLCTGSGPCSGPGVSQCEYTIRVELYWCERESESEHFFDLCRFLMWTTTGKFMYPFQAMSLSRSPQYNSAFKSRKEQHHVHIHSLWIVPIKIRIRNPGTQQYIYTNLP